ncbi:hypothetical protein GGX14DRAFT_575842 [Mycena pura]|uniref:Uncharacterized protein n=1 Tax=Mycena pura TaxID=153505 RepID=A0AAD6UV41_9AGAR|nr:hypothetical protein GGX14DRAFT_575842 [Mycena pura]
MCPWWQTTSAFDLGKSKEGGPRGLRDKNEPVARLVTTVSHPSRQPTLPEAADAPHACGGMPWGPLPRGDLPQPTCPLVFVDDAACRARKCTFTRSRCTAATSDDAPIAPAATPKDASSPPPPASPFLSPPSDSFFSIPLPPALAVHKLSIDVYGRASHRSLVFFHHHQQSTCHWIQGDRSAFPARFLAISADDTADSGGSGPASNSYFHIVI